MYFLGVDQSLREPGIAIVDADARVVVAGTTRVGATSRGAQRLATIQEYLKRASAGYAIVAAAVEGPSLGSTHREFDLGEVSGVARALIYAAWQVEPLVVAPTQLKLFATGVSSAEKDDVIEAVNRQWGVNTDNDNIADAITLAQIARLAYTKALPKTRAQATVIMSLLNPTPAKRRIRRKAGVNV